MVDAALGAAVAEFLYREAQLLDRQNWSQWLDLYAEDAVFSAPAPTMDGGYTSNPELELNYIYLVGRAALEARIVRIETNSSMASTPPARTCHLVTGVTVEEADAKNIRTLASWQVVSFSEQRGQQLRSGSYEYLLRRNGTSFVIARKKIMLLEHVVDGYFDVYMI
jgi:3-phenylpropionate/cinnamic acid dioxygenase small subunit